MATVIDGDFEWDDVKDASNVAKHGIEFREAALALLDPAEVANEDALDPTRTCSLVMSPRTRIISARKANKHEQRTYEDG